MQFEYLPEDSQVEILLYSSPCEAKKFLDIYPKYQYLFKIENNLMRMAIDYGLPYFKGITLHDLCHYDGMDKLELILKASKLGDMRVIEWVLSIEKMENRKYFIDSSIGIAAKGGHIDIVKSMLDMGATNLYWAMTSAAENGHVDIVKLLLEHNVTDDDINDSMIVAAGKGHIEIVDLMLKRGATDVNLAMESAAEGGHIDIVKLMLDNDANNIDEAILSASLGGHSEIASYLSSIISTESDYE